MKTTLFVLQITKRHQSITTEMEAMEAVGIKVFRPMTNRTMKIHGKLVQKSFPVLSNLFFARGSEDTVANFLATTYGLIQFKYMRGGYMKKMTVPSEQMDNFIKAVENDSRPHYLVTAEELACLEEGTPVKIVGGPLEGVEGTFARLEGSMQSLVVEVPGFLAAAVSVKTEDVQIIK